MDTIGHLCRTIQGSVRHLFLVTVQALREVHVSVMRPGQQPMQYCSSFEGGCLSLISCSSITLLDQQSLSQAWIECGNKTLLALLPTASIDKAFLVIRM